MSIMGTIVGISDDLKRVTIEMTENGTPLGWIEYTPEQVDHFIKNLEKFKGLIKVDKDTLKHGV